MINSLAIVLGISLVVYIAFLTVLNQIPHVSVKWLGWLSLRHITIETGSSKIYIRKVGLRLNLFRQQEAVLRFFRLEVCDIDITIYKNSSKNQGKSRITGNEDEKAKVHDTNKEDKPYDEHKVLEKTILELLTFTAKKSLFEFLYYHRLISQFTVHFFRVSIYHKEIHQKLSTAIDYSRIELILDEEGEFTFLFTAIKGFLRDISQPNHEIPFFRSIDFSLKSTLVSYCKNDCRNKILVTPSNFKTSLLIAKLLLPLDEIEFVSKKSEKKVIHHCLANQIVLFQEILNRLDSTDIVLEDFSIKYSEIEINVANFSTKLQANDLCNRSQLKFNVFIASYKLIHLDAQCFELQSGSFKTVADPVKMLAVFDSLIYHEGQIDHSIDIDSSLMLTNPTIDLYYDQFDYLFNLRLDKRDLRAGKRSANLPEKADINKQIFMQPLLFIRKLRMMSSKCVVVDLKVNLHRPKLGTDGKKGFYRHSKDNLIVRFSILAIVNRFYTTNLSHLVRQRLKANKFSVNFLIKLKNIKFNAAGNQMLISKIDLLCSYRIFQSQLIVTLNTKNIKMKSINEAIFHVVREFRNRSIGQLNERYSTLSNPSIRKEEKVEYNEIFVELFEILPSFVSSVRVNVSSIEAEIICKDALPSQTVFNEFAGKDIDLGDFKRGICVRLNDIRFAYKKLKEEINLELKNINCFTMSDYNDEYMGDSDKLISYNKSDSEESEGSSIYSNETFSENEEDLESVCNGDHAETRKIKRVLSIRDILLTNNRKGTDDINKLILCIPEVDVKMDIFFIWCTMYAKTLIHYFAPTVKCNCSQAQYAKVDGTKKMVKLDININSVAVVARLPTAVDVMFEFDSIKIPNVLKSEPVEFKYVRLFVIHPATKLWTRLLVIRDPVISFDLQEDIENSKFDILSQSIRLNIPHQFLFYTVIDNIITFFKAFAQIKHNFTNLSLGIDDFDRIMPQAKPAVILPHVNIKTKIFGITMENDPFENELAYIYELGAIEQRDRMKKYKLFEKKASELRAAAEPDTEDKIELFEGTPTRSRSKNPRSMKVSLFPRYNSPLRNVTTDTCAVATIFKEKILKQKKPEQEQINETFDIESISGISKSDTEVIIRKARDNLHKGIATSWIRKYKLFREVKIRSWNSRCKRAWGHDNISSTIIEKYDILNYSSGPHLMGSVFKELDLTIEKAKVPDIDQFLYDFGKKQPKLEYSILIPLFIQLRSKSFYQFLRDYPLPIVSFPENLSKKKWAVDFSGDVVINEKLVTRKEEMRYIYVPFSLVTTEECLKDTFYSVHVPRTLTPIKFMVNLKCDLDTDRACMLSWCKSYGPAFLAASAAFDNFTKPAIDDSPLGWWDKMALLLHGKAAFNIPNELCLHIKSSNNPYELLGRAAGFVFSWKNNVSLRVNDTGDSRELVQLDSEDFVLGIPNYSMHERKSWSLFYDEFEDDLPDIDSESRKFHKRVIKLTSSERVRWTIGMQFERNKDNSNILGEDQERVSDFMPHQDVVVTSPLFKWHPDSYTNFRSDYIHMSLSVVSNSSTGNSYNAAYFTPLTFHYFFYWWDLLTEGVSLPIRRGNLFKDGPGDPSHVNMGPHLFTIKYLFVFDPLIISHTYKHSTQGTSGASSKVAFTGLKAKFDKCFIDLHQRKEMVTYVNEKLNINNRVLHLKMNQGEVSVENADLRFVHAVFTDNSISGAVISSFTNALSVGSSSSTDPHKSGNTFDAWIQSIEVDGNDLSWVDSDDFIELEVSENLSPYPKIGVIPFCTTPRFSYFREFSLQEDGKYPFGKEESHDCHMEAQSPEQTQAILLKKRMSVLKHEISTNKDRLDRICKFNDPTSTDTVDKIKLDIKAQEEKLQVVEEILFTFTGEEIQSRSSSKSDLIRIPSRQLSKYSSHRSYFGMKRDILADERVCKFHNRFIIHNLQLKWNNPLRNTFVSYIQKVSDRKSQVYFMSKKAVDLVESVINDTVEDDEKINLKEDFLRKDLRTGEECIEGFTDELGKVSSDEEESVNKYLVKLIHPQIQLVSEKELDSCMVLTSQDLEISIISVNVKGMNDIISESAEVSGLIETRYGVLFKNSHIFVFHKDEDLNYAADDSNSSEQWPPWLESEMCYDTSWLQSQLVAERNTMAMIYKKPNALYADSKSIPQANEIIVHLSKVVINANSSQYSTIYYILTNLLTCVKTQRDLFFSRLDKIISLSDASDFEGSDLRVKDLQNRINDSMEIILKVDPKDANLTKAQKEEVSNLEVEVERAKLELNILMCGLGLRSSKTKSHKQEARYWNIMADQVIWHFLDSKNDPSIDFALASPRFNRIDSFDGSNSNKVEIAMIQGFNLQVDTKYPELLGPHLKTEEIVNEARAGGKCTAPIILATWKVLDPVGGIPIVQEAKLAIQPLQVALEYETGKHLTEYLFPNELEESLEPEIEEYSDMDPQPGSPTSESQSISSNGSRSRFKKFVSRHIRNPSKSESNTSTDSESETSILARSDSFSTKISSSEELSIVSKDAVKGKTRPKLHTEVADDISIIMSRSSKFMSIIDAEITKFNLYVSFRGPKHLNILNVNDLHVTVPMLHYANKMWSGEDVIVRVKKDIIKTILNHTGKILGSKFKQTKKKEVQEPLNQISDYATFMTLQDLQTKGRSRTSSKTTLVEDRTQHNHPHHHYQPKRSTNLKLENYLRNVDEEES